MARTPERRNDTRLLCADLIEVVWSDYTGEEKRRIANLEDISPAGMSLQLETFVRAGTPVRVLCGRHHLTGVVRHTQFRERAYFIGVEFDRGSQWSANEFLPQHLLDPRKLFGQIGVTPISPAASRWVN